MRDVKDDRLQVRVDPSVMARIEATLTDLADRVARQSKRQITMERHLADLGKVLGHLGVETENRLELLESVLDDLTAPTVSQVTPASLDSGKLSGVEEHRDETPVSLVVPLRSVSDDDDWRSDDDDWRSEIADLLDANYRARRSP